MSAVRPVCQAEIRIPHLEDPSLIFLAFALPLACYCLLLAHVNRGRHPALIPGTWDFAGILFALSGFLLVGGPAVLTGFYEQWRMSWLLGETRFLQGIGEQWYFWLALWVVYFAFVFSGAAFLLSGRRNTTSIYNINPGVISEVLKQVVSSLGLTMVMHGPRRLFIYRTDRAAEVEWDESPAMRHVTLRWHYGDRSLRSDIEAELNGALSQIITRANPVGTVSLSLAMCLFILSALGLFAVLVLRALQLPV
jgi:hypothetical protein